MSDKGESEKESLIRRIEQRKRDLRSAGLKLSDNRLSELATDGQYRDLIRNLKTPSKTRGIKGMPSRKHMKGLAKVLMCDVGWLYGEEGAAAPRPVSESLQVNRFDPHAFGATGPVSTTDSQPSRNGAIGDTAQPRYAAAWVPEVEARAGMGGGGDQIYTAVTQVGGITVETDAIRDHWGIPHSFLAGGLRMRGDRARIIEVFGDSMYDPANPNAPGSLFPGDRVVIDLNDVNPSMPGPFVIWDDGLLVKLVEKVMNADPPRLRIMSRNPLYKTNEHPAEDVRLIGRVRARITEL